MICSRGVLQAAIMAVALISVETTVARAAQKTEGKQVFEEDVITTGTGDLKITFLGHASLMLSYQGRVIYVDPVGKPADTPVDYAKLPKADIILVTHEHFDHFDPKAISVLRQKETKIVLTKACAEKVSTGSVLPNGEQTSVQQIKIEAIPAYNLTKPFHPKGVGNGYILTFDKTRVYVAGDTENTPEMKGLKDIAIAFLPMNLPYTMTPEMVADAAKAFKPKILYPYHYGSTDPKMLVNLLKDSPGIEVRVRKMN